MTPTTKEKNESLREWRELHFGELNINLASLKAIRDHTGKMKCPACGETISIPSPAFKEVIEATKGINKMLGALGTEKMPPRKPSAPGAKDAVPKFDTTEDEEERIRCLINGV